MLTPTDGILLMLIVIVVLHYIQSVDKFNKILTILQQQFNEQADQDIKKAKL